jgi:hypothetical protein
MLTAPPILQIFLNRKIMVYVEDKKEGMVQDYVKVGHSIGFDDVLDVFPYMFSDEEREKNKEKIELATVDKKVVVRYLGVSVSVRE